MLKFPFFNLPKPRKFNYVPRTYDPELEKFDTVRQNAQNVNQTGSRKTMLLFSKNIEERRKARKTSTIRLAVILSLLFFLVWWLFK